MTVKLLREFLGGKLVHYFSISNLVVLMMALIAFTGIAIAFQSDDK